MKKISFLSSRFFVVLILSSIFQLLSSSVVYSASGINNTITLQGKVVNTDGTNVTNGTYDFVFQIYNGAGSTATSLFTESWTTTALFSSTMSTAPAADGESLVYVSNTNESSLRVGQILWNVTRQEPVTITSVNTSTNTLGISPVGTVGGWATSDTITNQIYVKDGIFRVAINSLNQNWGTIDFGDDSLYVGVNFAADGEMKPRMRFSSVPYAMTASNALTLGSIDASGFLRSNTDDTYESGHTLTVAGDIDINGGVSIADTDIALDGTSTNLTVTGNFSINTDDLVALKASGNIGIGITNPGYTLDVAGDINTTTGTFRMAGTDYGQYFIDAAGTNGQVWTSDGTGRGGWTTPAAGHNAVTLGAIGSSPNANGMTLTNQVLNLEPADGTYGGVVSATTQSFVGAKTFATSLTSTGLLTASNGFTMTTGTLSITGNAAATINTAANDLTITSGHFNTTATGINSTAIGATTPSTAAFTTLASSGNITLGTGASSINTIGSTTTPGTLTLHGATTLDNTFTVSGNNLTSLGGNLTVSGTITGNSTITAGTTATYDPLTLSPVVRGANAYTGTITSVDLTGAQTWTLPNNSGTIALTSDIPTSQNVFTTIDAPSGTDPVADSATDTLQFLAGANITITGDVTNDSLTIAATDTDTTYTAGNDIDFSGTQIDLEPILNYVTGITLASGDLTLTTVSGNLVNISTGNLKVGNGTPGLTLNGEDAYIEGTLEVDGAGQFDGSLDTNGDLTIADTDIALDGASTNLSVTGNFSINTDDLFIWKAAGGYVGIGTTAPSGWLDIMGNSDQLRLSVDATHYSVISTLNYGGATRLTLSPNNSLGQGTILLDPTGGGDGLMMDISNATTPHFRIQDTTNAYEYFYGAANNVGIGTTNPGYKLQVAGDIDVTTGNTYRLAGADVGQYFIDAAGTNGQVWTSDGTGRGGWTTVSAGTTYTASNGITLSTADFQLGGNLTQDTTITQDAAETLTFTNAGTSNTVFNLSSTGDFVVQDNGTAALFVKDDGLVGIGTTNPVSKLHVDGGSGGADVRISGNDSVLSIVNTSLSRMWTLGGRSAYSGGFAILDNSNNPRFNIADATGNVGIGTTNPGYKLEVLGDINTTTGTFRMAGTDYGQYFIDAAGTNGQVWTSDGTGRGGWTTIAGGTTYTASNGITLSTADFQLGGDLTRDTTITQNSAENLTFTNSGTGNTVFNLSSTGDFMVQDNGTAALFVKDDGNVGIGTTNPSSKLYINTSGINQTNTYINHINSTALSYGGGSTDYGLYTRINNTGSITDDTYAVGTGRTSFGNYIDITDSGVLDNNGGDANKTLYGIRSLVQDTGTHISGTSTVYAGILDAVGKATNVNGVAYGLMVSATGADTNYAIYSNNGTNYFSGSVGIGTTNPGYKLQVAGDIDVTTGNTYRLAGADVGQYFIDAAGTNGQVWTSDGTGRGGWTTISSGTTYTAGNDIDFAGTQIDLEPQLDFVTTISRASSDLTLQTTTSGNINLTSAGSINVSGDFILTGKASSTSTTEGTLYYDTDDDQLKVYANGKWQADRSTATLIVAASDSKNKEKADYVADGTNDQTEINAAITALPSTGGTVVLLDGTYNIGNGTAGRITIAKSNVSLVGNGASTVIKRMFNETGGNGLIVIGDSSGTYTKIAVSNVSVNGNNGSFSASYNHGIYATDTTTYVNLTNNWINNAGGYGIYFSGSNATIYNVTGNYLAANTEGGIYAVTYRLNIANNQFVQNGSWGTSGYDIYSPDTGSSITNNVFHLPQYRAIRLSSSGVTLSNNTFRGCANYCVFLDSATSNIITGNAFYQDGSHTAIAATGSHRNTIADNNINELGNTRNGILLTGSSTNNTLTGNQIYSTNTSAGAAIKIDSGSTGNYLADNRFSGTGTATQGTNVLTDSATGTIYGGQTTNGNSNFAFTPTGNVGIGTTNPAFKLHVAANDNNGSQITISSLTNQNDRLYLGYDSDGGFGRIQAITEGTAYRNLAINSGGGNVGIGTTNPRAKLEVNGTVSYTIPTSFSGAGSNADWTTGFSSQAISTSILATGAVVGNGIYSNSDMRLKENISPINTDLVDTFFNNIDPVGFTWLTDNTLDTGFIAQDLLKNGMGYLVSAVPDDSMTETIDADGFVSPAGARYTVRYDAIVPILTAAIKKHNITIDLLEQQTALNQDRFSSLEVEATTHSNWLTDLGNQLTALFARQAEVETQTDLLTTTIADLQSQIASIAAIPTPAPTPFDHYPEVAGITTDISTIAATLDIHTNTLASTSSRLTILESQQETPPSSFELLASNLATMSARLAQVEVDLDNLELTASDSALVDTLTASSSSSLSPDPSTLSTDLNLDVESIFVSDFLSVMGDTILTTVTITNNLTVSNINSATGNLTIMGNLLTLDAVGNAVTINGDLTVTGLASLNELTTTTATVSGSLEVGTIYNDNLAKLASQSAELAAKVASISAVLGLETSTPAATVDPHVFIKPGTALYPATQSANLPMPLEEYLATQPQ